MSLRGWTALSLENFWNKLLGHNHALTALGASLKTKVAAPTTKTNHKINSVKLTVTLGFKNQPLPPPVGELIQPGATGLNQHISGPPRVLWQRKENCSQAEFGPECTSLLHRHYRAPFRKISSANTIFLQFSSLSQPICNIISLWKRNTDH